MRESRGAVKWLYYKEGYSNLITPQHLPYNNGV